MHFFNIDFHISVIADIAKLFGELGHKVTAQSLSNHTWVFGRQPDDIPSLHGMSVTSFGQAECDRFIEIEYPRLKDYDGFIVTHTPALAGLYEHMDKPIIVVVSTRYENLCFTAESRSWLDAKLHAMVASGKVILLANNQYDAWYCERTLGIRPEVIASVCDYCDVQWDGGTMPPFLHGRHELAGISVRRLPGGHMWNDVAKSSAAIHIPYNASQMSIFEHYSMGLPIIAPSQRWLLENLNAPGVFCELGFGPVSAEEKQKAIEIGDLYNGEMSGIQYFDDATEIPDLVAISACTQRADYVSRRKSRIKRQWKDTIALAGRGVPQKQTRTKDSFDYD